MNKKKYSVPFIIYDNVKGYLTNENTFNSYQEAKDFADKLSRLLNYGNQNKFDEELDKELYQFLSLYLKYWGGLHSIGTIHSFNESEPQSKNYLFEEFKTLLKYNVQIRITLKDKDNPLYGLIGYILIVDNKNLTVVFYENSERKEIILNSRDIFDYEVNNGNWESYF